MKQSFYYNGTILTMEGHTPQYAEAVLVEDGVIQAVGERSVLERDIHGKTRMINLGGKTMLPGFVDAYSGLARTVYEKAGKRSEGKGLSVLALLRSVTETARWYASFGITTAQEGNCGEKEWQLLRFAGLLGRLPIDVACYFPVDYADGNLPCHYPMQNAYSFRVRKAGCMLRAEDVGEEQLLMSLHKDWQMSVHAESEAQVDSFLRRCRSRCTVPVRPVPLSCGYRHETSALQCAGSSSGRPPHRRSSRHILRGESPGVFSFSTRFYSVLPSYQPPPAGDRNTTVSPF